MFCASSSRGVLLRCWRGFRGHLSPDLTEDVGCFKSQVPAVYLASFLTLNKTCYTNNVTLLTPPGTLTSPPHTVHRVSQPGPAVSGEV